MHDRNDPLQVLSLIYKHLSYDRDTGVFRWKVPSSRRVRVGEEAGTISDGYIVISLDGKMYKAHRLVWLIEYNCWPTNEIDHYPDRTRSNNRITNLRDVTGLVNIGNKAGLGGELGYKGVSYDPNYAKKPYRVQIERYRKVIHRSHHSTLEEASLKAQEVYAQLGATHK